MLEKGAATPPGSGPSSPTSSEASLQVERKKAAEQVRANIEKFVDGLMSEKYTLAQLLNDSFSLEMLELLFKRMTGRLRGIIFSREKTLEFIRLALDASYPRHTRAMAAQFIVVGGAVNAIAACEPGKPHQCSEFWDSIFDTLQREADGVSSKCDTPLRRKERLASVAELEELIQVAVQVFEKDGAETLQQSFAEHQEENEGDPEELARRRKSSARSSLGADADAAQIKAIVSPLPSPRTPVNGDCNLMEETTEQKLPRHRDSAEISGVTERDEDSDSDEPDDTGIPAPLTTEVNETAMYGIFSHDSANFASQVLRYFAIRGQKGACILHFLAEHPATVDMLLANIGHDDIRTLLLHLIYAEHSEAAITSLFETHMMQKLIQKQVTFSPPRNAFERDCIENTFMLLREIVHAPYLTGRGVAISAKTIPLDKVTGQDEYVSICGASRETANSALRKYTSRKVRRLIHLFMQEHQAALELLFVQMIKELTFWSTPLTRERRGSVASLESLMLLSQGHPRPTCITMLMHLFELTETVEFTDNRNAGGNSAASVGIDCLNFLCSTHLMRKGNLLVKKKLKNELQVCQVSLNCMMGLRTTAVREDQPPKSASLDKAFTPNLGNQSVITLDEMENVQSSDWHEFGFSVTVKKKLPDASKNSPATQHAAVTPANAMVHHQRRIGKEDESSSMEVKSIEYFAASSEEEKQAWITLLQAVIDGDLNELEIFCSDDWRSNVREYRRLRECLITCMERKGHELMVFLKQVITFNTRRASGYHLWSVVKCLNSVLSNESKRLDRMFVGAHVITTLITCYEKYPMWNLLLGEITKMLVFCIGDFKSKRSRKCPIIGRILQTEGEDAKLAPLLCKVYLNRDAIDSNGEQEYDNLAGTDALSNLKLIMEALKMCYKDPKTRSQEHIQCEMKTNPVWRKLVKASEELAKKDPFSCILTVGTPPALSPADVSNSSSPPFGANPPTPPTFQEDIINQISRPSYSTAHGFGSSFLEGDGCSFGYLFKERHGGREWKKALVVYEYGSHKLWYFYPSEVDETHAIQWKWIVPLSVRSRYTHGQDETHSSVGHHGLYITAYDHQQSDEDSKVSAKEMHFSVTKLEDRDLWKDLLSNAADTIQKMARDYSVLSQKLKKPDKKTVTHCQDPTCHTPFKLFRRPHSCKRCGKWMCAKCTSQRMSIPEVGLLHPVRHCRECFEENGGAHAETEPFNLFHLKDARKNGSANGVGANVAASFAAQNGTLSNAELYELAHGMVSPRTLMQMNRRLTRFSSIDSPTGGENGGFHADEINAPGSLGAENLPKFADDEDDFSPFSPSLSRRSLLNPREDIRG
ncbi:FYVE zinc finger domain-containing protein [Phytophthora infestans]|uniref:FYVE zinc finger domain-containing protein n=1 Tax=Phytophthora infestans TaxID=4787 RepID=A0A833SFJ1_PHYIN|nr:FYVE zinc finger domain-containing protein [Phytophthora infestans]KAF4136875.1 FYVE zinc finger domain-containing protein [Phytophthora infestans]